MAVPPKRIADAPAEDLTQHPAYALGVQHAHSGIAPNPFADGTSALDAAAPGGAAATLPRAPVAPVAAAPAKPAVAPAVAGIPSATQGGRTYAAPAATNTAAPGSAADAYIEAQKPVLDQQARKAAGVSEADWKQKPGGPNDPFTNGFFKPAAARSATLNAGRNLVAGIKANQSNRLATLPRAAGPAPAVGGTQAILPGTRQPLLAGAGGDVTSQFADRSDPTLDKNYLAGKDKATIAAALPRARKQSAVVGAPDSRDFWAGRAAA